MTKTTTKKFTGFEVKERWTFTGEESNPYGYVVIINIDGADYQVVFSKEPMGWFFKYAHKVGSDRQSPFRDKAQNEILEYCLAQAKIYEESLLVTQEIKKEEEQQTMTNEAYFTLEELMTMDYMGLATTQEEINLILESAKRENDFYVGTNVKEWLKSMDILDMGTMEERFAQVSEEDGSFIEGSYMKHLFKETRHDNTYNWSGHSSTDIDFRFLQDGYENMYAYVQVHIGTDPRGGYTKGLLIDLDTYSTDCIHNFVDNIFEHGNDGYIELNGVDYSISGDILGEYLSVYSYDTHESYEICDSVYCWSQEEFDKELKDIVLEALKENQN